MTPIVETHQLVKNYGRFGALQGVSLSIPQGSVFALMGASGAGKTTAIKILLDIIPATRGTATILGVDSRRLGPSVLAHVGYVSENQVMPARLRVADFFAYLRPCYASWDRALEEELRVRLGLPPTRRIGELSHGMRLKMALACALPFRPKLVILDEPLSGLDPLARDQVIDGFMSQAVRTTIVISSHELDEIERFATHAALLHEGRLLFQGSVVELEDRARPLFSGVQLSAARRPSLRDIFVALVRAAHSDAHSGERSEPAARSR